MYIYVYLCTPPLPPFSPPCFFLLPKSPPHPYRGGPHVRDLRLSGCGWVGKIRSRWSTDRPLATLPPFITKPNTYDFSSFLLKFADEI